MEVNDAVAMYEVGTEESDAGPAMVRTEVGLLPHDWRVSTFEGLAHIQRGKFSARPRNDPKFFGGHIPFIQTGDVTRSNGRIDSYSQTLNDLGLAVSRVFPRGTMFFTIAANIGDIGFADFDAACPDSLVAVTPRASIDKYWLSYELKSRKSFFEGLATQNAQMNINLEKLRPVLLPVPACLNEQQAIAEALSDADALIESLSLLLAKKRQIKQGTMQELLTARKRLPGFDNAWTETSLGRLGCTYGGLIGKTKSDFGRGQARYITFMNVVTNVEIDKHQTDFVDIRIGEAQNRVAFGDLLFNGSSETPEEVALCSHVADEVSSLYLNSFCFGFRPHDLDTFCGLFMAYFFRSQSGRQAISALAQGATRYNISKTALLEASLRLPAVEEQRAIAEVLSSFESDIAAIKARLAKARDIKQGMMQSLLTGLIRLAQPVSNAIPRHTKFASPPPPPTKSTHNRQINEAVVIAVLAHRFGTEQRPLPRKRRVKLMYLLHRHAEGKAEGYRKKAAGPYDPNTKYKGPEQIALKNGYVRAMHNGTYEGFVAGDKIDRAQRYFEQWYGTDALEWLERFRYLKTDELELLATVDMAMMDLAADGEPANLVGVKRIIAAHPEWVPKLSREVFSDDNIARTIAECAALFPA